VKAPQAEAGSEAPRRYPTIKNVSSIRTWYDPQRRLTSQASNE
jgi:hypothetical protein